MRYLSVAIFLAACTMNEPTDRTLVEKDTYRALFTRIEQCSGLHGDVEQLKVYVTPLSELPTGHSGVFIAPNTIYVMDVWPRLLAHEFMHYDLERTTLFPGTDHPKHYFNDVCGDLTTDVEAPY